MLSLAEYVAKVSEKGPPMPGIILGIRMCLLAMNELELDDPAVLHRKLIVVVETDRCLPDVVEMMLGCRLGNRTLKFHDWGKMAATFVDLTVNRGVRVAAQETVEQRAVRTFQRRTRNEALSEAYRLFPDEKLFDWRPVEVPFRPEDLPGYRAPRVLCERCGEGISFHREVQKDGRTVCRACAGEVYWRNPEAG